MHPLYLWCLTHQLYSMPDSLNCFQRGLVVLNVSCSCIKLVLKIPRVGTPSGCPWLSLLYLVSLIHGLKLISRLSDLPSSSRSLPHQTSSRRPSDGQRTLPGHRFPLTSFPACSIASDSNSTQLGGSPLRSRHPGCPRTPLRSRHPGCPRTPSARDTQAVPAPPPLETPRLSPHSGA